MPDILLIEQIRKAIPLISVEMLTADLIPLSLELKLMEKAGIRKQ